VQEVGSTLSAVPQPRVGRDTVLPWAVAIAVAVNSGATAYGFHRLRSLADEIRFVSLVIAPTRAAESSLSLTTGGSDVIEVELFWDLTCRFCRASIAGLDSAREALGERAVFVVRFVPITRDPTSMAAALTGACADREGLLWRLLAQSASPGWRPADAESALSAMGFDRAVLRACRSDPATVRRVWRDVFHARARGIRETPALSVGGLTVTGRITAEALTGFIRAGSIERPAGDVSGSTEFPAR